MMRLLPALGLLFPFIALAQVQDVTPDAGPPLNGIPGVVNAGPGNQTDPHLSGTRVAYTDGSDGGSAIRYHDLADGTDRAVPTDGGLNSLSDISGSRVIYNHFTGAGASIFLFDIDGGAAPMELDPQPGSYRLQSGIGGDTVAWQDFSFDPDRRSSEIVVFELGSQTATRLTRDTAFDKEPSVSPSGDRVVFNRCDTDENTGCHIQMAARTDAGWTVEPLTVGSGEDSLPDTNGALVVYSSVRDGEEDLYWQPVEGGTESRLVFPGLDHNPNLSGNLLAFEHFDTAATVPNWDIYLYDFSTNLLYRLTETAVDETLNDISVESNGVARVVWTAQEGADANIYALALQVGPRCEPNRTALEICADPRGRELLATVDVERRPGRPLDAAAAYFKPKPTADAVLCVENRGASIGWVFLNLSPEVGPKSFEPAVERIARKVNLCSRDLLTAAVAGDLGVSFRAQIYGPDPSCSVQGALPPPSPAGTPGAGAGAGAASGTDGGVPPDGVPAPLHPRRGCSQGGGAAGLSLALAGGVGVAALGRRRAPAAGWGRSRRRRSGR